MLINILLTVLWISTILLIICGSIFVIYISIMLMIEIYIDNFDEIFVGGHQPKNRPDKITPPNHGPAYRPNKEVKNDKN